LNRAKSNLAIARQPKTEAIYWEDLCFENPSQDPSPFHPFPSSLSPGRGKRGKGVGVRGYFHGFRVPLAA
jgi:hypothetical protein